MRIHCRVSAVVVLAAVLAAAPMPVLGGNFGLELEVYHFQPDIDDQVVRFSSPGFSGNAFFPSTDVHVTRSRSARCIGCGSPRAPTFPGAASSPTSVSESAPSSPA